MLGSPVGRITGKKYLINIVVTLIVKERCYNIIVKICVQCKKIFIGKQKNSRFCSSVCRSRFYEATRPKREYNLICDNCGKEYKGSRNRSKKENIKFCTSKCEFEYFKKNNSKTECVVCKKKFVPLTTRHKCCCRVCKDKYMNYKKERICEVCGKAFHSFDFNFKTCSKKCFKELKSDIILENLKKGIYSNTFTKQHKKINGYLEEMGINFRNEERFGRYSIDIFLIDYNLCIEIMGKYWHLDCRHFKKENTYVSQEGVVEKDFRKRKYIEENYSVKILYLWEDEINKDEELCKRLIKNFIKTPFTLKSYQSSSYNFNKRLRYDSKKPQQYFEYALND